ncbi:MAG: hypothetical protein L0Y56_20005 [Nitrospira sp.]|nr:hypothetical protein [Nitrospira sp.]
MGKESKEKKSVPPEEKKKQIHIPLIPILDDSQELDEEMQKAFEEDQVRHKHGGTEPERD